MKFFLHLLTLVKSPKYKIRTLKASRNYRFSLKKLNNLHIIMYVASSRNMVTYLHYLLVLFVVNYLYVIHAISRKYFERIVERTTIKNFCSLSETLIGSGSLTPPAVYRTRFSMKNLHTPMLPLFNARFNFRTAEMFAV